MRDALLATFRRHPRAKLAALQTLNRANLLLVDYPARPDPRYGWGKPEHPTLTRIIGARQDHYREQLVSFARYAPWLARIDVEPDGAGAPGWRNRFTSGLDGIAIYGFLCERRPAIYFEVGSGN